MRPNQFAIRLFLDGRSSRSASRRAGITIAALHAALRRRLRWLRKNRRRR